MDDVLKEFAKSVSKDFAVEDRRITRVEIDEYQLSVLTPNFKLTCYTQIDCCLEKKLKWSLHADIRRRDSDCAGFGSLVGESIKECTLSREGEPHFLLTSGQELILRKADVFENFAITEYGGLPILG